MPLLHIVTIACADKELQIVLEVIFLAMLRSSVICVPQLWDQIFLLMLPEFKEFRDSTDVYCILSSA
jgi:hypothetical protein